MLPLHANQSFPRKVHDEELVARSMNATKKQPADKREAVKPKRTTKKAKANAKAAQASEVSYTLLMCTHD